MIAIGRATARTPVIFGVVVAMLAVATGIGLYRIGAGKATGASVIAIPATSSEPAVLDALKTAGIDKVWAAANTAIPLSDFSRIVDVSFAEAESRARPGDPRRTPLFDELERRFIALAPDGTSWRLLYVQSAKGHDDAAISAALAGLGTSWALIAPDGAPFRSGWLWIPVCGWGAWLIIRRPKGDRLRRALLVCAWLPMLVRDSPEAAILAVVLQSVTMLWVQAGSARAMSAVRGLFITHALLAVAMLVLDPLSGLHLLVSATLGGFVMYTWPRVELFLRRRWIHKSPNFVPLTANILRSQARLLTMGLAIPALVIGILAALVPGGQDTPSGEPGLRLERSLRLDHIDGRDLLEKHIAYQRALTWGRIGDAVWGQKTFTEAYQYVEKSGTMHRSIVGGQATSGHNSQGPEQAVALPGQALAILSEDWAFRVNTGQHARQDGK
ncbi:MAG TPA: hypothetical protein VMX33_02355 [bacterium]|nr:hypothetical protein [bacterium]